MQGGMINVQAGHNISILDFGFALFTAHLIGGSMVPMDGVE